MSEVSTEVLEEVCKGIGAHAGEMEKRLREELAGLRKVLEEQAGLIRLLKTTNSRLETEQRRTIEAQGERIRSIEAMFAQPGPVVEGVSRRLS